MKPAPPPEKQNDAAPVTEPSAPAPESAIAQAAVPDSTADPIVGGGGDHVMDNNAFNVAQGPNDDVAQASTAQSFSQVVSEDQHSQQHSEQSRPLIGTREDG